VRTYPELPEEWADHRLPERLERLMVRRGLSVDDARGVLVRGEHVKGLGPIGRARLEEALGPIGDVGTAHGTVPARRRNTDLWSPEQWERIAERAEEAGLGGTRLSALPSLVAKGWLVHPDVSEGQRWAGRTKK
jgi:hypothetical protein